MGYMSEPMTATLEVNNNRFLAKFSKLRSFFVELNELFKVPELRNIGYKEALNKQQLYTNLILEDIKRLQDKYYLKTTHALCNYYYSKERADIEDATQEYFRAIDGWSFNDQLDEFAKKAQKILECILMIYIKKYYPRQKSLNLNSSDKNYQIFYKIQGIVDQIKSIKIDSINSRNEYEECLCGYKMDLDGGTSEVRCPNCLEIRTLDGTVFEDPQHNNKENNTKVKGNNSHPNRHYNFWMDRLLGKGKKTLSEEEDRKIDYLIKRDGLELNNVYEMRNVFREANLTQYNDHASLIMKLKTGISPPQPDFQTLKKISCKFNRIIEGLNEILDDGENNRYYPYFIYKICEDVEEELLEKGNRIEAQKLKTLRVRYIYLQSDETVEKNDRLYEKICSLPGNQDLRFRATDRNSH